MKKQTLTTLLGIIFGTQLALNAAVVTEQKITPVKTPLVVAEVKGQPQYAYDSTGWKTLKAGKVLQPGATVRAAADSTVLLRAMHAPTFIKVSPGTQLHLTMEAPSEERVTLDMVRAAKVPVKVAANGTKIAGL